MATLMQAKTASEMKKLGVSAVREAYDKLATDYNRIIDRDVLLCPSCGNWMKGETGFYLDRNYVTDRYPICKRCIQKIVEQRKTDRDEPNETKQSVQKVLQMMDRPYDNDFYEDCVKAANDELKEKNRSSPFATYFTALQSLPQYRGKKWSDSDFGDSNDSIQNQETKYNQKTIKNAKKRFGNGYSNDDYMFLEQEYQDWITRYECNTKAQESIYERLAFKKWEINKATKSGQNTKDLDKTYQDLLSTANITPRQTGMDSMADAQTFGTLIQKYEETRPLPDIDPELEDVDKIGLYIDVFYRGHACKMLGLKNAFSHIYEKVMKQFTVTKPQYDEDEDSEIIFDKVFGSITEE